MRHETRLTVTVEGPRDEIDGWRADEVRDEDGPRAVVDLLRAADLLVDALVHHRNAGREALASIWSCVT